MREEDVLKNYKLRKAIIDNVCDAITRHPDALVGFILTAHLLEEERYKDNFSNARQVGGWFMDWMRERIAIQTGGYEL